MVKRGQIHIKYAVDRVFAVILIVFLSPLFLLIAIIIKKHDGASVFYRDKRMGWKRRSFTIWKFRTMIPNADAHLNDDGSVNNVERVTKFGKKLRMTSLDELPQLINIIKGDMSFIGPRPTLLEHFERYSEEQKNRFLMRPGITGLAQVNGRNNLLWSRRIKYDLEYIGRYSFLLDIKIILKTIKVVLKRDGISLDRNPGQVDDLGVPLKKPA